MLIISFVLLFIHAATHADAETTNSTSSTSLKCNSTDECNNTATDECQKVCGCDGLYKYDDVKEECVIDYVYLKERTKSSNLMHTENDVLDDDGMAKKIREDTERVFRGIIYCAIFFILCVCVSVISVCVFCCRIHYSDHKLKNEVKTLADKLKMNYEIKESTKKNLRDIKEESCNVIVEDANVICV